MPPGSFSFKGGHTRPLATFRSVLGMLWVVGFCSFCFHKHEKHHAFASKTPCLDSFVFVANRNELRDLSAVPRLGLAFHQNQPSSGFHPPNTLVLHHLSLPMYGYWPFLPWIFFPPPPPAIELPDQSNRPISLGFTWRPPPNPAGHGFTPIPVSFCLSFPPFYRLAVFFQPCST